MRVVGTFHPSSSVSRSLKCHLTPDTTLEHLAVAKTERIEVYSLQPDGFKLECTADMWGRVVGLQAIPVGVCQLRLYIPPALRLMLARERRTEASLICW